MPLRFSPSVRVTIGLMSLAMTLLLFMDLVLGVFPSQEKMQLQARQHLAESMSVQLATMLSQDDQRNIPAVVNELVKRNPDLRSIGVRMSSGELIASSANHLSSWTTHDSTEVGRSRFIVPMAPAARIGSPKDSRWGQIEFAFKPLDDSTLGSIFNTPSFKLIGLFGISAGVMYYIYLRRTFQHLDPSSAVPERVQMAFDALSEAVLVVDNQSRIVMANDTFVRLSREHREVLIGKDPSSFRWLTQSQSDEHDTPPWQECMNGKSAVHGNAYEALHDEDLRRLIVNCSPVLDARDAVRGCMVSFSDVTEIEEANQQLVVLMTELAHSKEQLQDQNVALQKLASSDPMTGALNRRAFFPLLEGMFNNARATHTPMSFVMCDIDKFKSINDVFGHPVGDKVIQKFSSIILRSVRDTDEVCRYGGEEFCIALGNTDVDQAMQFAERVRQTVETEVGFSLQLEGRPFITASFGVSSISHNAPSAAALIEQADQALYVSKNSGRNQCTIFAPEMAKQEEAEEKSADDATEERRAALKTRFQQEKDKLEKSGA
ncbi:diguanylate cyclase [Uliginosibacterium sp. H3]|uniref:diguanylate cyclase n=1 Tax=Uliginosibacterium silvisoli TaxID=3114758 RepID=A0ABU6K6W6_9RHOO|nr:diguanylate cyclase [Uliginosibacterium sp. H3]